MWIIEYLNNGETYKLWLRPGKSYIISRPELVDQIKQFPKVVIIDVEENTLGISSSLTRRLKVTLIEIDNVHFVKNKPSRTERILNEGDTIDMTYSEIQFRLAYEPVIVYYENLPSEKEIEVLEACKKTGIKVLVGNAQKLKKCTHFVCAVASCTETIMIALIKGIHIVDSTWLSELASEEYMERMQGFYTLPNYGPHLPPMSFSIPTSPSSPSTITKDNRVLLANDKRRTLFKDTVFISLDESDPSLSSNTKLIQEGGGTVIKMDLEPNISEYDFNVLMATDLLALQNTLKNTIQKFKILTPMNNRLYKFTENYARSNTCGRIINGMTEIPMAILLANAECYCSPWQDLGFVQNDEDTSSSDDNKYYDHVLLQPPLSEWVLFELRNTTLSWTNQAVGIFRHKSLHFSPLQEASKEMLNTPPISLAILFDACDSLQLLISRMGTALVNRYYASPLCLRPGQSRKDPSGGHSLVMVQQHTRASPDVSFSFRPGS
ncbi:6856_t:CDS:2 [Ambispora gerdemannii]|uniref:6856_t:CDS:1 n=1 Tax=Ambispora gerdemannii TaxID=144530 RepID=A0A9N8W1V4_9GLOM|nr:6856_t:CDS:2 [Ambispora gerdemannii]